MNQFMTIQNFYKNILEKRSEETASLMPDYTKDSREAALQEVESNKTDRRKELMKLLDSAKSESSADTKTLNKMLPESIDSEDTTSSNALVKIAMNMAFFEGLRDSPGLKTASADYLKTIYTSFNDESAQITKLATALGKLTSKAIRATPTPRVNLPAPKVSL